MTDYLPKVGDSQHYFLRKYYFRKSLPVEKLRQILVPRILQPSLATLRDPWSHLPYGSFCHGMTLCIYPDSLFSPELQLKLMIFSSFL